MRLPIILLSLFLLAGCVGNVRQNESARFDLGSAALVWRPADLALGSVEVTAPSWLAGTALQYRLLYADPLRRQAYNESRWAAPPAELLERALNRQPGATAGCRLRIELDELAQVFDAPAASRVLLDARAALATPRGDAVLARKAFSILRPAQGADARGGVEAAAGAAQELAGELGAWLAQAGRETPGLAARCRG